MDSLKNEVAYFPDSRGVFVFNFLFEYVEDVFVLWSLPSCWQVANLHIEICHDNEVKHLLKSWMFKLPRWLNEVEPTTIIYVVLMFFNWIDLSSVHHYKLPRIECYVEDHTNEEKESFWCAEWEKHPEQMVQTKLVCVQITLETKQNSLDPTNCSWCPWINFLFHIL